MDQIIIAILVVACLVLCFICWYQDEQLAQRDGYIARIERENAALRGEK